MTERWCFQQNHSLQNQISAAAAIVKLSSLLFVKLRGGGHQNNNVLFFLRTWRTCLVLCVNTSNIHHNLIIPGLEVCWCCSVPCRQEGGWERRLSPFDLLLQLLLQGGYLQGLIGEIFQCVVEPLLVGWTNLCRYKLISVFFETVYVHYFWVFLKILYS